MSAIKEATQHSHSLTLKKDYSAPVSLLWELWTNPEHLAQWWGPFGAENTHAEINFVVGGIFFVDMRAADGSVHPCRGTIQEIIEHERFVIQGDANAPDPCGAGIPPNALVTINFEPIDENRTTITMTAQFASDTALEAAKAAKWAINGDATLQQLVDYMQSIINQN